MKLLYITNGINGSGGLERVLSIKSNYLVEQLNYKVHILTLNNGHNNSFFDFNSAVVFHDIPVSGNPISYVKSYLSGIKNTIKKVNMQFGIKLVDVNPEVNADTIE